MRFGLAAALMGDGAYHYNGWGYYSWFDEYDVKLGYPITAGSPVAGTPVWRRDFDGGVALVNTSNTESVVVKLGATMRALSGTQDAAVNDGRTVTELTLPPRDGRLLLK